MCYKFWRGFCTSHNNPLIPWVAISNLTKAFPYFEHLGFLWLFVINNVVRDIFMSLAFLLPLSYFFRINPGSQIIQSIWPFLRLLKNISQVVLQRLYYFVLQLLKLHTNILKLCYFGKGKKYFMTASGCFFASLYIILEAKVVLGAVVSFTSYKTMILLVSPRSSSSKESQSPSKVRPL